MRRLMMVPLLLLLIAVPATAGGKAISSFSDGPAPFPLADESGLRAYLAADTWVVRMPGGIKFSDGPCRTSEAPALRPASAAIQASLGDIKAGFERMAVYIADADLNSAWVEYAASRLLAETTLAKAPVPQPDGPTCTEGRCDCCVSCCAPGRECSCQEYVHSASDCRPPTRGSCNVDTPKVQ